MSLLPCPSCPWRIEQDSKSIPGYDHEKACGLLDTVGPEDGFRQIMACHYSTEAEMKACRGYLAIEGWKNINVRLLLAKGKIDPPDEVLRACEDAGVKLHPNYPAVLRKLTRSVKNRH